MLIQDVAGPEYLERAGRGRKRIHRRWLAKSRPDGNGPSMHFLQNSELPLLSAIVDSYRIFQIYNIMRYAFFYRGKRRKGRRGGD